MFKLIKFIFSLSVLALLAYVVLVMPLGKKTLFEHLVDISKTDEATVLKEEIEKKVDDASEEIKTQAASLAKQKSGKSSGEKTKTDDEASSSAQMSDRERLALKNLIRTKTQKELKEQDRTAPNALVLEKRQANK